MWSLEDLEKSFYVEGARKWADDKKHLSVIISVIYLLFVVVGQRTMKNIKAVELRAPLFIWNIVLALFSTIGTVKIAVNWRTSIGLGLLHSVCDPSVYTDRSTAIWTFLFGLSKAYELGDTAFLILRKKPVIFLHWYHHATVFIYAAYSYAEQASSGRWYMMMNYSIHSIMYSYYAFMSLKLFRFPKVLSAGVTSLQILQMIVGLVISSLTIYFLSTGANCKQSWENAVMAWLIYFSYLVLFLHFFYHTYLKLPTRKKIS